MDEMASKPGAEGGGGVTPTLIGRLQTRLILTVVIGLPWTVAVTVIATLFTDGSYSETLNVTLQALGLILVIGLVLWEPLYHGLQQFRWEKDWPTGLGLLTAINEGVVVWLLLDAPIGAFLIHFVTTWTLIWFVLHGPLRAVVPRWRYRGGRFA